MHDRDDPAKQTVARFTEHLGLEAVILHEQPNRGRTLMAKFREEAVGVGFAVVLMTPDDVGGAADAADQKPGARQNVVYELGFYQRAGASPRSALGERRHRAAVRL